MLDLLDASPLAATLRDPGTRAYFELPFSWDWDGVPVHGTIDLAYEFGGAWRLLDFKTDDVRGEVLAGRRGPVYTSRSWPSTPPALERATGRPPEAGLLFLRTGDVYRPTRRELDEALAATRARVDGGQLLETPPASGFDDTPTRSLDP